jgi:hypothetical protein
MKKVESSIEAAFKKQDAESLSAVNAYLQDVPANVETQDRPPKRRNG